jgi:thymidylate synthase
MIFNVADMSADYLDITDTLVAKGTYVSPRGMDTYELENVTIRMDDPRPAVPVGLGRRHSDGILAAETMQWLAGVSDLAQLDAVSKNKFSNYSDNHVALYGAYGPRAYHGLEAAVAELMHDPDSRRAVVSLWDLHESPVTKDLPCTLNWGFRIRDGRLNMTTTMRSNDVFTGVTYDIPAMTRIQSAVAWALDVDIGAYTHFVYSLHLYGKDLPVIEKMSPGSDTREQPPLLSDGLTTWLEHSAKTSLNFEHMLPTERWRFIRDSLAQATLVGDEGLPPSFEWYAAHLRGTRSVRWFCDSCRYYLPEPHFLCPSAT